jgi:hypothetical protein
MEKNAFSDIDLNVWKFTENWTVVRLVGAMTSGYEFWIPIVTPTGRQTHIRKLCLDWDPATESRTGRCPYCKAELCGRRMYYSNAIIRNLQGSGMAPRNARTMRHISPIRVLMIPPRLHEQLASLAALNKKMNKKRGAWRHYDLAHPKFGRDVRIKINPTTPYSYYALQPLERTRLTAEELAYPLVPLVIKPEPLARAEAEWKKLKKIIVAA